MGMVKRGEVYWVNLDPTVGTEIKKTRPCLIVSPDDLNTILPRVIVAPLTSKGQKLGCRPEVDFAGKKTRILLDPTFRPPIYTFVLFLWLYFSTS
jgi:mRNA interferase MazF